MEKLWIIPKLRYEKANRKTDPEWAAYSYSQPFTGLDRDHTANLTRLLRKLAQENRLVIASHHDVNTLADIFDHVLLLNRQIVAYGECQNILTEENLNLTFKNTANV